MPTKRKVVFIIVEGVSDQTALAAVISKLINTENVTVEFTSGDITSDNKINPSNVVSKIGDFVKNKSKEYYYEKQDILEVIHIIDTDGYGVDSKAVMFSDVDNVMYELDAIKAKNPETIIKRNLQKSNNIKRLISQPTVWRSIPYSIYYMSCNLEHVLFDIMNLPWEEKDRMAGKFAVRYKEKPEEFLKFINSDTFSANSSYKKSWEYISLGNNSLKRFTNFNLVFSNQAKNIKRELLKIDEWY